MALFTAYNQMKFVGVQYNGYSTQTVQLDIILTALNNFPISYGNVDHHFVYHAYPLWELATINLQRLPINIL